MKICILKSTKYSWEKQGRSLKNGDMHHGYEWDDQTLLRYQRSQIELQMQ